MPVINNHIKSPPPHIVDTPDVESADDAVELADDALEYFEKHEAPLSCAESKIDQLDGSINNQGQKTLKEIRKNLNSAKSQTTDTVLTEAQEHYDNHRANLKQYEWLETDEATVRESVMRSGLEYGERLSLKLSEDSKLENLVKLFDLMASMQSLKMGALSADKSKLSNKYKKCETEATNLLKKELAMTLPLHFDRNRFTSIRITDDNNNTLLDSEFFYPRGSKSWKV